MSYRGFKRGLINPETMKNNFCCEGLQAIVEAAKCALKYRAYTRDFILTVPEYLRAKQKNTVYPNYKLSHCPRCSTKFTESLADEWYDTIEKELGIDGLVDGDERKNIPHRTIKIYGLWRKSYSKGFTQKSCDNKPN